MRRLRPSAPLLCAPSTLVPMEAGDPAAVAQASSALILDEVNRPTQLASSAASPRAMFAEFGGRLQIGELPTDVNGAVAVGADALGEHRDEDTVGRRPTREDVQLQVGSALRPWMAAAPGTAGAATQRQCCFRVCSHHWGPRSLACFRARGAG
jgi:hypothetical protein